MLFLKFKADIYFILRILTCFLLGDNNFVLFRQFSLSIPDQMIFSEGVHKEVEMIQTANAVVNIKFLL